MKKTLRELSPRSVEVMTALGSKTLHSRMAKVSFQCFRKAPTLWKIGQGGCQLGRRCQICSNTSINIINRALLGGATLSEAARLYGLALGSLHRHRSNCLGLPTSRAVTAAPSRLAGIEAAMPTRE